MSRFTIAVAMLALLAGCGKSEAPPPAEAPATPAPEAAAPAPEAAAPAPEAAAPAPEAAAPAPEAAAPAPEAAAPAPEAAAPAPATPAPSAEAAPAASSAAPAVADVGKATYEKVCVVCHGVGVAGAPKFGDKDAWGPRIAQGKDTLHQHALKGFMGQKGMMPPKGGNPSLSDDEVMAAVDYMVSQAQ